MSSLTSKTYSKDPRHLVLLKGYSLKERTNTQQTQPQIIPNVAANQTALSQPSPLQAVSKDTNLAATQIPMMRTNSGGE